MNATIEIDGLRKRFGATQALDGMTFTVGPGQVTGFVGPNGAGKSTTMRVILGLDAAASGNRITLRITAPADAMAVLTGAGAEVAARGPGVLTISDLSSERVVALLAGHAIPFSEVTAHRATLEQAYLELTIQSVEYRAEATS